MRLTQPSLLLTSEAAIKAVCAAVAAAQGMNVLINAAVVEAGGNLTAFLRCPGAALHSIGIAIDKAYTAASFGFPTGDWSGALGGNPGLRERLLHVPRLMMIGGGLPIRVEGIVVGGIGVSGASEEQDLACAEAALVAIGLEG